MWLAVGMPVVGQMLAAHRAEAARVLDVAFCAVGSADAQPGILPATEATRAMNAVRTSSAHDAAAPSHRLDRSHSSHASQMAQADHPDQGDVCGYCSLLANHPPLVMPVLTGAVPFAWVARAGPAVHTPSANTQLVSTPPARAPPAVS